MAGVRSKAGGEGGQASLLMLGTCTLLFGLAVVLFAFGQAFGSKGRHQRAADLAAVSAGQVMQELYPRLFEPPVLATGCRIPGIYRCRCISRWRGGRRCGGGPQRGGS
jgi:hypothetical protein